MTSRRMLVGGLLTLALGWGLKHAGNLTAQDPAVRREEQRPTRIESQTLPNLYRIHADVLSGGLPTGEAAFEELRQLGVKTVISVDGARPDVATAKKFGLRYVHLPHGYDGIEPARAEQLAKAVRELAGPMYIHCHHGKHRSPAAAAVACIGAGIIEPDQGELILRTAGTSEQYRGLYEVVAQTRPIAPGRLRALIVEFRETEKIPPFAAAMVQLDHAFNHLKQCVDAGWKSPADQPALSPAHEALIVREHYTEMLRSEDVVQRSPRFRELLAASEIHARELETLLQKSPTEPSQRVEAFQRIAADCTACHREFRDVPMSQRKKTK